MTEIMDRLGKKLVGENPEDSALFGLARILPFGTHWMARRDENNRCGQKTVGFLHEFLLVNGPVDLGTLVKVIVLSPIIFTFDFSRNAYVVLQYIVQQSYSQERKEQE